VIISFGCTLYWVYVNLFCNTWVSVCVGVLVICVLVFSVFLYCLYCFCIVCTVFLYCLYCVFCFVYVNLFLFALSVPVKGLLPPSDSSIAAIILIIIIYYL
jgi:hypothetical protein